MFPAKRQRLDKKMHDLRLDAVALNAGPTLAYLTGLHFHLMERPIVLIYCPDQAPVLVLPVLEEAKLEQIDYPLEVYAYPDNPSAWPDIFKQAINARQLHDARLGIEPQQLRLLEYHHLRSVLPESAFIDASVAFSAVRCRKDDEEVQLISKAVAIAERALQATLLQVKLGMSEYDLANELVIQLLRHGSEPHLPFSPIVASGPHGANPHARPSQRTLAAGDLVVIDWGARWHGYISDLTRTFAIGPVGQEEQHIHRLVQQANAAGRAAGRPDFPCSVIDDAARSVIQQAGYGSQFFHRTGHGIGLECHESPYIHAENQQLLQPGMTFTVEPGIYLPEKYGVRIEDNVVITETGCQSLSSFSRDLITLY
jgi:Xaa-Pro dipeptidase